MHERSCAGFNDVSELAGCGVSRREGGSKGTGKNSVTVNEERKRKKWQTLCIKRWFYKTSNIIDY